MAKMERQVHFRQGKQAEGNRETGWLRIPGKWLQKMRVDPEHPDVTLFFDGEKITIEQKAKSGIRKSPLAGKARLHRFARVWLALISGHRSNPQVERFFAGRIFGDTCFALGFDMDGGQSLARAVPGEPHLFSDSRILQAVWTGWISRPWATPSFPAGGNGRTGTSVPWTRTAGHGLSQSWSILHSSPGKKTILLAVTKRRSEEGKSREGRAKSLRLHYVCLTRQDRWGNYRSLRGSVERSLDMEATATGQGSAQRRA